MKPIKETISTDRAPAAIGPYSQAIRLGELLFTSGQIPVDAETGTVVAGDISDQTKQVLKNLEAVLLEAGASMASVLKTTVFLSNMDDFQAMNKVYGAFFSSNPPARSTVQVARLPLGVSVEIEAVALIEEYK
ncbi:MAG: RidA family protein [Chloroflexota bacterium]